MKLFVIVVLVLAFLPALLDSSMSGRAALDTTQMHPASAFIPSNALNTGSARVEVPATVYPAHPNNRGFLDSIVSISTTVHVTSNQRVVTIAKAASYLNPAQLWAHYAQILQWLQIQLLCFIGGVFTVCQYLLFLAVGSALIQKHIIRGLALQSEPEVEPVPVGAAGPVVECRVPNTQAPVPAANPSRRPLVRRPLLNPTIPRLGGLQHNTAPAPQPVAPVQPPHPGSWHEEMSVEGKLVFYSHSTGPGGSLEWTAQYFPRREYWYYISQYAANPTLDPLMDLLLGFRPFIVKVPGEIMEEVFDYLFSKSVVEPEVDATSALLPPSRPESSDGPTPIDMMDVSTHIITQARPDSSSNAFVATALSDTGNTNTTYAEGDFFPLPLRTPAIQRRKSTSHLQTSHTNPTTFSHPLSQRRHSTGCVSIATQQTELPTESLTPAGPDSGSEALVASAPSDTGNANTTYAEADFLPLPFRTPALQRRKSTSHLQICHTDPTTFPHPLSQRRHSTGRMSIANPQIEVPTDIPTPVIVDSGSDAFGESAPPDMANAHTTCVKASFFPLPLRTPAPRRRKSTSQLQTRYTNATTFAHPLSQRQHSTGPELRHPPQHWAGSGMELEKDERADANINEVANPAEEDGIAEEGNIMPKEKFKYRRGGKRLTARKNRQRKQDEDQGNPEAGPSSAN
ncbi:hypothetical protein M407DRAFT_27492 [Tulasnella calospora MUT 4182]|uniref:Uncharacterized protein n=1 Tax=Tulasnella calospora MUT 4182 TaxID=1051891 RepID=A0A0C3KNP8_9AGAM|nr:hypothetical protein M407DRAFT_27492 [Tulasnella calospora MUT 4182]